MDREELHRICQQAEDKIRAEMGEERWQRFLATSDGDDRGPHVPAGFVWPNRPRVFDPDETERRILGIPELPDDLRK